MTIAGRFLYDTADAVRLEALAGGSWAPLADLVAKLIREERYHRMHAGPGSTGWPGRDGEPRDRLLAALEPLGPDAASVFTQSPGKPALLDAGILRADARSRDPLASALAPDPRDLDLPMPHRPATRGAAGGPWRGVPLAVERVHARSGGRPGSDLVSEGGIQVGVARGALGADRGRVPATQPPRRGRVRAALGEVMDPELPMLSMVDLGMVHRCGGRAGRRAIRVELLPTFVGCPALEMIRAAVAERLAAFGRPVEVDRDVRGPRGRPTESPQRARPGAAGIAPPSEMARARQRRSHRP